MLKKETFNLEDSNCAALVSDEAKAARANAAETEAAWKNVGSKVGQHCWRIEQFKVVKNEDGLNGLFFGDDSYIFINTYKQKDSDKLHHDIHFWLGEKTTQDEMGTAAYKTVELDDVINGRGNGDPVQHREVMGHESSLFCSYFADKGGIRLQEGKGAETGFNHVKPEEYKARLLHLKGKKNIRCQEVPLDVASFNCGDVFILDAGLKILQWQGKKCGKNERARAGKLCRALDDERKGLPEVTVFSQGDRDEHEFWDEFPSGNPAGEKKAPEITGEGEDDAEWESKSDKVLYQLSDASGKIEFKMVAEKTIKRSMLNSADVFIFDVGNEIFAWTGKDASKAERKNAMNFAMKYLKDNNRPNFLPISSVLEGGENEVFEASFD